MHRSTFETLQRSWNRMADLATAAENELRHRELSQGTYHDVRAMNRLRVEIERLDTRMKAVEKMMMEAKP